MTLFHPSNFKDKSDFRNEIKFKVFNTSTNDIAQNIKRSLILFSEEYQDRWVNNIYFDNSNMDSMYQSIEGDYMRYKTRLRWYDDYLFFFKPKLELKIKKGYMNTKKAFACSYSKKNINSPFSINKIENLSLFPKVILTNMRPVITNRYFRKYLISSDKKVRITIDSELRFSLLKNKIMSNLTWEKTNKLSVIELKFNDFNEVPRHLMTLLNKHYSLSQMSKYTYGLQLVE